MNRFLRSYNETKETHRWLQARKRDGYSLPETQDEYVVRWRRVCPADIAVLGFLLNSYVPSDVQLTDGFSQRMLFEDKTHTKQKRIQRSQGRVRSWRSMMR